MEKLSTEDEEERQTDTGGLREVGCFPFFVNIQDNHIICCSKQEKAM